MNNSNSKKKSSSRSSSRSMSRTKKNNKSRNNSIHSSRSMSRTKKNNNSRNNSQYKSCPNPTKINYCQDKSSGGHQGNILSIDKTTCIKKLSSVNNELKFYDKHNELIKKGITVLQDYIPKYDGICSYHNNNYFIMENLKSGFQEPLAIDIKFGYKTASKLIIKAKTSKLLNIYKKLTKHYILDKLLTPSSKYGFRIEGVSLPSNIKFTKFEIMRAKYSKLFALFFTNDVKSDALKSFIEQLDKLLDTIKHPDFVRYKFVGASILFTYDGQNPSSIPSLKIIDFDNSIIFDDEDKDKVQKNIEKANLTRKALLSLSNILKKFLGKKMQI